MSEDNLDQPIENQDPPAPAPASFYDSLSPEFKEIPSLQKFKGKDLDTFVHSYLEQETFVGKKGIIAPNYDDQNDVSRFYSQLGVPETADGYDLPEIEGAEDLGYNADRFKEISREANLTPQQTAKLQELYINDNKNTIEQMKKAQAEAFGKADKQLGMEWGAKKAENIANSNRMIDAYARSPEVAERIKAAANADPELRAWYSDLSGMLSENSIVNYKATNYTPSPEDARRQINEIRQSQFTDKPHAYYSNDEKVRTDAIETMLLLEKLASGQR